jgi:hypothetical protein
LIDAERAQALKHRLAATADRSLVGVMNEYALIADLERVDRSSEEPVHAANHNPCGPIFQRHISPDRTNSRHSSGLREIGQTRLAR